MSRSVKKYLLIVLCAMLAVAFGLPCLVAQADTDFSRRGSTVKTVDGADFLQNTLHYRLSDGELRYLQSNNVFQIRYSNNIPGSYVKTSETGTGVTVTPNPYSYTSDSGKSVVWSPVSVNGVLLQNGQVTLNDVTEDYVTVVYQTQLAIDKDAVNELLNSYYYAAKAQSDRLALHRQQVADRERYLADLERYNTVLLPAYQQYQRDYAEWQRKNQPYQEYLRDRERYLAELDAYVNYDPVKALEQYNRDVQRYQQYLVDIEQYNALYEQYLKEANSPDLVKMRSQLAILDYMYALCQNRSLRESIMGDTVAQVLTHSEDIKTYLAVKGSDTQAVDRAERATRNLRNLIEGYEEYTDDEGRYGFYCTNYEKIKDYFGNLLRCLDYLYRDNFIRGEIAQQGKDLPYRILLAQLYEICNALDNGRVENYEKHFIAGATNVGYFDENYRIAGQTPEQILGECVLQDTDDAQPLKEGVPQIPQPPQKPQEVLQPTPPERPQMPIAPDVVPSPGPAPDVVPEPRQPDYVPEPAPYTPTDEEKAMQQAFDDGQVTPRELLQTDYVLSLQTEFTKYFRNVQQVTVFFHASDEAEPYPVEGQRNTYIEYPADLPLPQKSLTGYTCEFDGWVYEDGEDVDWTNMREGDELHLYPKFRQIANLYDVFWVIDGKEYVTQAPYDSIPEYDGTPTKGADADGRIYRFEGWDRQPVPVTEQPDRYTARFEASLLVTWNVDGVKTVTPVWRGDTPSYPNGVPTKEPSQLNAYIFDSWDKPLTAADDDVEYTAQFTSQKMLTVNGVPAIVTNEDGCFVANFTSSSAEQKMLDISVLLQVAEQRNAAIALSCNTQTTLLRFSAEDVFKMRSAGVTYYTFFHSSTGTQEYLYRLLLFDGEQNPLQCDCTARVTVKSHFSKSNSKLFRTENGVQTQVRLTFDSDSEGFEVADFVMRPNEDYNVLTRYTVTVASDSAAMLTASATENLRPNVRVTLNVLDVPGKKLQKIYAEDAQGNEIVVTDNTFVMPQSDVTVYALTTLPQYTVTFKSEGMVLQTRTYFYGDTVTPPADPFKAPDGTNAYVFDGWDRPIVTVTGDAVYNATFKPTPLGELGAKGLSLTAKLLISLGAVLIAAAAAITVAVVLTRKKRARKKAAAQQEASEQTSKPKNDEEKQ